MSPFPFPVRVEREERLGDLRIVSRPEGCRLDLRVVPGARSEAVLGSFGGRLRVRVRAPAERGRANRAVRRLLARELGIRESRIEILSGHASRDKVVLVRDLSREGLLARLPGGTDPGP